MNPVLQFVLAMIGCGLFAWLIETGLDYYETRKLRRPK